MNAVLKLSQLNGLISDIFDGIGNAFSNIMSAVFAHITLMLYQWIIVPLLMLMNGMQILFKKLAGLDTYRIDGASRTGDIVLSLIENKTIQNIFWSLVILAVILLFLTTIVALIRSETQIADEKPKSKTQIFSRALKALVNFFMVPVVAILGVVMGNALLKTLDKATSSSNSTIGGIVFKACASEANRARKSELFASDLVQGDGYNSFGLFNGDNNVDKEYVASKIDDAFANFTDYNATARFKLDKAGSLFTDGGDSPYVFQLSLIIFSEGTAFIPRTMFSMYDAVQVFYYYDLLDFNFLLAIITSLFVSYVLFVTAIGLIKRFYKLTTLLVVSPVIASIAPLDEGKSLGRWRESFIQSCLSGYSTIVILNIMLALLGPLTKLELFVSDSVLLGMGAAFLNNLAVLLIVCGGFAFFQELSGELAKIIGAEDAYASGGKATEKMAKVAGQVAGAVVGVGKGLKTSSLLSNQHDEVNKLSDINSKAQQEHGGRIKELEAKQLAGKLTGAEKDELNLRKEKINDAKNKLKEAEGKEKDYRAEAGQLFKSARQNFASATTGGVSDKLLKPINDAKDGKAIAGAKFGKYKSRAAKQEAKFAARIARKDTETNDINLVKTDANYSTKADKLEAIKQNKLTMASLDKNKAGDLKQIASLNQQNDIIDKSMNQQKVLDAKKRIYERNKQEIEQEKKNAKKLEDEKTKIAKKYNKKINDANSKK